MNSNLLKFALAEKGLSIRDLSGVLEISIVTLYRKLSGKSDFYRDEIIKICELIGKEYLNAIFFDNHVA